MRFLSNRKENMKYSNLREEKRLLRSKIVSECNLTSSSHINFWFNLYKNTFFFTHTQFYTEKKLINWCDESPPMTNSIKIYQNYITFLTPDIFFAQQMQFCIHSLNLFVCVQLWCCKNDSMPTTSFKSFVSIITNIWISFRCSFGVFCLISKW